MTEKPAKPTGFCDSSAKTVTLTDGSSVTEMPAKPTGFCDFREANLG